MVMAVGLLLAICVLAGSALVLGDEKARTWAIACMVGGGIEVAVALKLVTIHLRGFSLMLVLGAVVAVCGLLMLLKVKTKNRIIAATVVIVVGVFQTLVAARFVH